MIPPAIVRRAARPSENGDLFVVLDGLSNHDRRVVGRLALHLAAIEGAHGEEVALAVAQRMEMVVRGRNAA